jgi:hypothetical protein
MLNSIHTFSHHIFYFSQAKTLSYLSHQQKKIVLLASLALGSLALGFIAIRYSNKNLFSFMGLNRQVNQEGENLSPSAKGKKPNNVSTDEGQGADGSLQPTESVINKVNESEEERSHASFREAMELMFEDRKLDWGGWLNPPLTPEQKTQRHEDLKKAIENILPADINKNLEYRDRMMDRQQTLLLQAIMCIKDSSRRLEIVKILIEKGADPRVQGFYYADVDPIGEAQKTYDSKTCPLIQLLNDAVDRFNSK